MKQNITQTIIIFVSLITLSGCSKLDLLPEANLSDEVFWKSDADFRQATNYLYKSIDIGSTDPMAYPLLIDVMSDNAIISGFSSISNGSYLPGSDFGPWNRDYGIIRAANNIIEHIADFKSANTPGYIGEAQFFRAYAYADLVSRYGDVPLILKTLNLNSEELYQARTPRNEIIQAIYSDLDSAALALSLNSKLDMSTQFGMVTSGAALAFKSRVALREGTWNKFHNNADYEQHLQLAKDAAMAVMNSQEYSLFNEFGLDSYRQLFKFAGEGPENKEAIWTYPYGVSYESEIRRTYYAANVAEGLAGISRSLVDDFLCTDGLPIDKSPLYQGQQNATSEFADRDLRLNGTVVKQGDGYTGGNPYINSLKSITGYTVNKYFDRLSFEQVSYFIDMIMIRYAEVLLNYAEATYELNNTISDNDLDLSINLLRDRVGMPHLTNDFVSTNALNMQTEIRRERRVELGMEGFRYDDLLRWKTAEVELPKPILGVRIFAAEYPGVDPSTLNLTQDSVVIVEAASKRNFDPSKNYLWPLPLTQLALNTNLTQNSGW